ncbi:hypothetical protein C8Q73DRAFT_230294 [Cubamyces lactineus]|nr:hypothetical protein C8Q73DRAFT_230294 [Cubamyces lactineus]
MELGAGFHKVRAITFAVMITLSLLWTVLLSVEIFLLDAQSDPSQRNFVGVFIFIDALTVILLPALLLVQFRPWLDAARLLFLLLAHFGVVILFTAWNSTFACPTSSSMEYDRCRSVNLAILICGWSIPSILVWYSAFLAVMYYWRRGHPVPEGEDKRLSDLPMMLPSRRPSTRRPSAATVTPVAGPSTLPMIQTQLAGPSTLPVMQTQVPSPAHTTFGHTRHMSHPSWLSSPPTPVASSSRTPPQRGTLNGSAYESSESAYSSSPRSSGRLSKPAPLLY